MRRPTLPVCFVAAASLSGAEANPEVAFNRDIRPILAETCFHCHGPDPGSREANLRLDLESGLFTGDPAPVVKGNLSASPLYQRITSTDPDEVMPPPNSQHQLKPEEIALLGRWIEVGARWEGHWSFEPLDRPELPEVADDAWVRNPIDRFILAGLEAAGLVPAPEADPRTLVRRLSLDLTGLPPDPAAVEAYAANPTDKAWDQVVDALLASPRYGEHRARYWLDAARYADTHGLHFDNYREMWPYRDWVVAAFNRNQSFDRFTVEQLAGDLLPDPTLDQLVASGFQRCNITTNEGGTIEAENLANYAADRVQTFGWVYMGLTTNCAQCHDHKFDPITMKDYYAMAAFFRNTTQSGLDGNVKDGRGPAITVPIGEDRRRWDALPSLITEATAKRDARREAARPAFASWSASLTPETQAVELPAEGLNIHLALSEGEGNEVVGRVGGERRRFAATGKLTWVTDGKLGPAPILEKGSTFDLGSEGDFEIDASFSASAWVKSGDAGNSGGIIARMDEMDAYRGWDLFQAGRKLAVHLVHRWPEAAIKVSTEQDVLEPGQWRHVAITWDGSGKPEGVKIYVDGLSQKLRVDTNNLQPGQSIRTETPLRLGQRSQQQGFVNGGLQDVRLYTRALDETEVKRIVDHGPLQAILAVPAEGRTAEQEAALYEYYLGRIDPDYPALHEAVRRLEEERESIRQRSPVTHVQEEKKDSLPTANILMRGQYDKVGEEVPADTPSALFPMPENAPHNRLGLAQWVVDPNNPLTARVTVNRFWQEVFGRGIVETSEDFGIMGTPPTHPELLDWLAFSFVENDWDVKRWFKMVVNSSAYRQSPAATPEKLEKDPGNHLLSRGPRFRMDGEMIRDYALAASGALSSRMGGPGARPYQPEGIWDVVGLPGGDTRNYVQDHGVELYRRSLYNFWKRMAPPPNLEVFNAPSREVCTVRRERTNTPLQALVTLNDPQFVEAARQLAQEALAVSSQDDALDFMSRRVLARPCKPEERPILEAGLSDLRAHYEAHPEDAEALLGVGESPVEENLTPSELAAWTMLANQLLNLDETLSK